MTSAEKVLETATKVTESALRPTLAHAFSILSRTA
jgi:hypothetical protein